MVNNSVQNIISLRDITLKKNAREESVVPPWLFKHQELIDKLESATTVDQQHLINTINYINFKKGALFVCLSHPQYEDGILIRAYPEPCESDEVVCRWTDETVSTLDLNQFKFQRLIIVDDQSIIIVPGDIKTINTIGITVRLPHESYDICQRTVNRHVCRDIHAKIVQNGVTFRGIVIDFSPIALCIRLLPESSSPFIWLNSEIPVTIYVHKDGQTFFSGSCRCIRQTNDMLGMEIVLAPRENAISRFKKATVRSPRRQFIPPPTITFKHPFFERIITREIHDISNSGFSIHEGIKDGVLMAGMIIPALTIKYAGAVEMNCDAQVIYREVEDDTVRLGLAILDMGMEAFGKLNQILNHVLDHHNYISNKVDMDALWEFFFDSNFIYPNKYKFIHSYSDEFKETYRKIYQENPDMACHFTYEKDGKIYGHIAMVRAYERAWLIHHFAAKPMESKLTGFLVLKQLLHYLNGIHRLPSAHMDCVMTYYRNGNKIIDRIFGGYARHIQNPQASSLDLFSYLVVSKKEQEGKLPPYWDIRECTILDLWKLDLFYKHHSGGLLMNALGLGIEKSHKNSLEEIYKRQGFVRQCKIYSLTHYGDPVAYFVLNRSDLGFNLSELLNGIKIIITESEQVDWHTLSAAIAHLAAVYDTDQVSLLIYPPEYTEQQNIEPEKQYQLWILNIAHYGNDYLQYMEKKFRMRLR